MGKNGLDLSKVNPIRKIDYRLSQAIYDLFNQIYFIIAEFLYFDLCHSKIPTGK